jgi:ActR/RegA family two-component response regulator
MQPDILIVGAHHSLIAYGSLLKGYGYHIATATTISETYALLAKDVRPKTFIVDLKFADLCEVVPTLRAVGGANVKIIVMGAENAARSLMLKQGANIYLSKPAQPETILEAVQYRRKAS